MKDSKIKELQMALYDIGYITDATRLLMEDLSYNISIPDPVDDFLINSRLDIKTKISDMLEDLYLNLYIPSEKEKEEKPDFLIRGLILDKKGNVIWLFPKRYPVNFFNFLKYDFGLNIEIKNNEYLYFRR